MSKKQGVSEERLQCIFFLADDLIIRLKRLDSANLVRGLQFHPKMYIALLFFWS